MKIAYCPYCNRFSPPYRDGTAGTAINTATMLFSPPYGDGTKTTAEKTAIKMFSPPYGDGTDNSGDKKKYSAVFAPLRGWYGIEYV